MSNQSIYMQLVSAGMSPAGACAMMGNFNAESVMRANNVEDRMHRALGMTDEQYTAAVDNGSYTNFVHDGYGYGLYQLTYYKRKENYFAFAKARGTSIGDESTQVAFCVHELKTEYNSLWKYLCSTKDIETATSRVCIEFERPAVNNTGVRTEAAKAFYKQFSGVSVSKVKVDTAKAKDTPTTAYWPPRTLAENMVGSDVYVLQALLVAHKYTLTIDGKFGSATTAKLKAYQKANGLTADGIAGAKTWAKITKI